MITPLQSVRSTRLERCAGVCRPPPNNDSWRSSNDAALALHHAVPLFHAPTTSAKLGEVSPRPPATQVVHMHGHPHSQPLISVLPWGHPTRLELHFPQHITQPSLGRMLVLYIASSSVQPPPPPPRPASSSLGNSMYNAFFTGVQEGARDVEDQASRRSAHQQPRHEHRRRPRILIFPGVPVEPMGHKPTPNVIALLGDNLAGLHKLPAATDTAFTQVTSDYTLRSFPSRPRRPYHGQSARR